MKGVLRNKIKHLRRMAGMNQGDLANRIDVSSEYISLVESGKRTPSLKVLSKIANEFKVDINYLTSKKESDFSLILRSDNLKDDDKKNLIKFSKLAEDYYFLEKITNNHYFLAPSYEDSYNFNEINTSEFIKIAERIARSERSRLGLGDQPIKDIFNLIETQGVHVIRQEYEHSNISGAFLYSNIMGAYILVNSSQSYGRQVFTAAHEYYHYINDRNKGPRIDMKINVSEEPNELMANAFASYFLMPARTIRNIIELFNGSKIQGEHIIYLKRYFGVSYEAMLYRLKTLDLISDRDIKIHKKVSPKRLEKRLYGKSTENIFKEYIPEKYFSLSLLAFNVGLISVSKLTELWKNFIDIDPISVRDIVSSSKLPGGEELIGEPSN